MASYHSNGVDDRKASSFHENPGAGSGRSAATPQGGRESRDPLRRRDKRLWRAILVDVILLLVIAGVLVGAWFGYRAIRDVYAPTWETRAVVFTVRMENINPDMVKYHQDGRISFTDNPIWSSDRTNADRLGTVTRVTSELVSHVDENGEEQNTLTLTLTVEATADYREGKGYRMGETLLLAGLEGDFRVEGMVAPGMIMTMHEKADETTPDTEADTDPEEGTVLLTPEALEPQD